MPIDVGIVMPVYRQRYRFLRAAIKSVLNQSYKKFRLVIVLDGSPPITKRQVRHLIRGDRRVRVISLPHNQGIAGALNRGFQALYRHSHIRYLTWVSSDNVHHKDFIYQLRHTLRHSDKHVGLVYSAFRFIDDNGNTMFDANGEQEHMSWMNQPKESLLDFCFIGASFLYKRRYAERTGPYRCEPVEDYDYWLRLAEHCDIRYLPKPLLDYRVNSEYSVTRKLHSSGSMRQHRRWRYAYETAKYDARHRRGIRPEVSVVVPFGTGSGDAVASLESLYEQTFGNFRVKVVDVAPHSESSRHARRIRDPRVTWIRAKGMDLHHAIQLGAAKSNAPLTMIYPATTTLSPHHLQALLNNHRAGSATGEVSALDSLRGQSHFPTYLSWEQGLYETKTVTAATHR